MNFYTALNVLQADFSVDEYGMEITVFAPDGNKRLNSDDIDSRIHEHEKALAEIASSNSVGGTQYHHVKNIEALKVVRRFVDASEAHFNDVDSKFQPSLFDNDEYREMLEIMNAHKIYKSIDTQVAYAFTLTCKTCGDVQHGTDEDLHIAHQLMLAGFRKS